MQFDMKLLRLSEVRNPVPYSRAQIYRLASAGSFPRPYHLGGRAAFWLESEIDAWIAEKVNAIAAERKEAQ